MDSGFFKYTEGGEVTRIAPSTLSTIERSLKKLKLAYRIKLRDSSASIWQGDGRKRLTQIADIYIAKESKVIADMILARKHNDPILLGRALGYPKTAVEAFTTDDKRMIF